MPSKRTISSEKDQSSGSVSAAHSPLQPGDEIALRRYEIRWSFYKVLAGSTAVGVVAAFLPFVIDYANLYRQETVDHRAFVDKYIDNALRQDIEVRVRFAEYFSYLADRETRDQWRQYHEDLKGRRNDIRQEIHDRERLRGEIMSASGEAPTEEQQIELAEVGRHLSWLYGEVGYAEQDVSIVLSATERSRPFNLEAYKNATTLKAETVALVGKSDQPFSRHAAVIEAHSTKLAAAHEFAAGIPNNQFSARQWEILLDPERALYGGFIRFWQTKGSVSPAFRDEFQRQLAEAFDLIICLEASRQEISSCPVVERGGQRVPLEALGEEFEAERED